MKSAILLLAALGMGAAIGLGCVSEETSTPVRRVPDAKKTRVELPIKEAVRDRRKEELELPLKVKFGSTPSLVPVRTLLWQPSFEKAVDAATASGKPVLLFQLLGRFDEEFC